MAKRFQELVPAAAGRFDGISRPDGPAAVKKLRGWVGIAYTLAKTGANRLWLSLKSWSYVGGVASTTALHDSTEAAQVKTRNSEFNIQAAE